MPFCRKCSFEVGTWMSFCSRCGASLAPLTTQPRGYWYRVTPGLIPQSSVMALLAFSMILLMNLNASKHVSLFSQVFWIAPGIAVGLVLGIAVTMRQLSSLGKSETGKTIPAIAILLFTLGGCFILLALFFITLPPTGFLTPTHLGVFNFIFCASVVFIPTRTYLLVKWERNHKMRLYQKGSRFYAFPKPDSHDNQYSNT